MKKQITYNDLYLVEKDIASIKSNSPALWLINENKFRMILFGDKNRQHVEILHKRLNEIQLKYIDHDAEGNPIMLAPVDGQQQEWKFLESAIGKTGLLLTGDEVSKAYFEEAGEFLKRSVTIEF